MDLLLPGWLVVGLRALLTQAVALGLLTLLGLPLVLGLAPARWRAYAGALAPALGLALFTVAASALGALGLPAPWTAGLLGALAGAALGRRALGHRRTTKTSGFGHPAGAQGRTARRWSFVVRPSSGVLQQLAQLALPLAVGLLGLWPLLAAGYLAPLGRNTDWEFYVPLAEHLRQAGAWDPALEVLHPLWQAVGRPIARYSAWGFSYTHAAVTALVRQPALATFVPLLLLLVGVHVGAWWACFRLLMGLRPAWAWYGALLLGLNANLLFTAQWSWANQVQTLPLVPLAILTCDQALRAPPPRPTRRLLGGRGAFSVGAAPPRGDTGTGGGGAGVPFVSPSPCRGAGGRRGVALLAALALAALPLAHNSGALPVAAAPLAPLVLARLRAARDRAAAWRTALAIGAGAAVLAWPIIPKLVQMAPLWQHGGFSAGFGPAFLQPPTDWLGWSTVVPAKLFLPPQVPAAWAPLVGAPAAVLTAGPGWEAPLWAGSSVVALAVGVAGLARWRRTGDPRPTLLLLGFAAGGLGLALSGYRYGFLKYGTSASGLVVGLGVVALQELVAAGQPRTAGRGLSSGRPGVSGGPGGPTRTEAPPPAWHAGACWRAVRQSVRRPQAAGLTRVLALGALLLATAQAAGLEARVAADGLIYFDARAMRFAELRQIVPPGATVWLSGTPPLQGPRLGIASYALLQADLYGTASTAEGQLDRPLPAEALPEFALLAPHEDPLQHGFHPADAIWQSEDAVLYRAAPGARALFLAARRPAEASLQPKQPLRLWSDHTLAVPARPSAPSPRAPGPSPAGRLPDFSHPAGAQGGLPAASLPPVVALYVATATTGYVELVRDGAEHLIARLEPGVTRLEGGVARTLDVLWSPEGDATAPTILLAARLEPTAGGAPAVVARRALLAVSRAAGVPDPAVPGAPDPAAAAPGSASGGLPGAEGQTITTEIRFASGLSQALGATIELARRAEYGAPRAGWWDVDVQTGVQQWLLRLDPVAGTVVDRSPAVGYAGRWQFGPPAAGRYTAALVVRQRNAAVARLDLFELTMQPAAPAATSPGAAPAGPLKTPAGAAVGGAGPAPQSAPATAAPTVQPRPGVLVLYESCAPDYKAGACR